jgi:hypothetical protein
VSIPSDYNNAKGRACRYEVVGEVGQNPDDKVEFTKPVQSNANSVKVEPKTGSTPFYRGYTDGYMGNDDNVGQYWNSSDATNYEQGYEKGQMHREDGFDERYRYVTPGKSQGSWPNPTGWRK